MADPELPAAADPNTRLTAKFQSLHRRPALEALGVAPPPAEPAPPSGEEAQGRQWLQQNLPYIRDHGLSWWVQQQFEGQGRTVPTAEALERVTEGVLSQKIPQELLAANVGPPDDSYDPIWQEVRKAFQDQPQQYWQVRIGFWQAENKALEAQHGAYADVDWLLGANPQLVGKLPAGAKRALAASDKENLIDQIGMAAGITNQQLQELINRDNAYSAAELSYEEILKEDNPPANPGFRDAFDNRNRAATEFYDWAIRLRKMRASYLQRLGLIPTPPAATFRPDAAPARPPEAVSTARVPENARGDHLIQIFDNELRRALTPSVPIEVSPTTLAGYLKESFKFRVGGVGLIPVNASLESINLKEDGAVDLLASGAVVAPGARVDFNNIEIGNYAPNGGVSISSRNMDMIYSGKAVGREAEVRNALANLIKTLTDGINKRLKDKNWEVEGLHIQDGRVRFEFKKKIKGRT